MSELIKVGIADFKLCDVPDQITTIGLGSCVGVALYSQTSTKCGLLHIMLPSSKEISNNSKRAKFADTGIEDMIEALEKEGLRKEQMYAKIAGGAAMFAFGGNSMMSSIGERNVMAVKDKLASYDIPIVGEDTGANYGRTIVFDPITKDLIVRATGKVEIVL